MGISKVLSHDGARSKGTDPSLLSTVEGLSIINLTVSQPTPAISVLRVLATRQQCLRGQASHSVGCLPSVTPGAYCGGAGCLIGNRLAALDSITLRNVSVSSRDPSHPTIGWSCANATQVSAVGVTPAVCQPAGEAFGCSET